MAAAAAASAAPPAVLSISKMGLGPMDVPDPFLFCVFHRDLYPPGAPTHMRAPRAGNGADFNWAAPYRMCAFASAAAAAAAAAHTR